jgi:hypothetical protein
VQAATILCSTTSQDVQHNRCIAVLQYLARRHVMCYPGNYVTAAVHSMQLQPSPCCDNKYLNEGVPAQEHLMLSSPLFLFVIRPAASISATVSFLWLLPNVA